MRSRNQFFNNPNKDKKDKARIATDMYKDKYTITVGGEEVLLDMHIKSGKGSDFNMIRIYFYYSPELKKSIIGYMPGHLPTRKAAH